MSDYIFTQDWFSARIPCWQAVVKKLDEPNRRLTRAMEIGSYEGMSACWLIDNVPTLEHLVCVDTWLGSAEHNPEEMSSVEARFDRNIRLAKLSRESTGLPFNYTKVKDRSFEALAFSILSQASDPHQDAFPLDLIYIDGSHEASDVLTDLVMAYPLLRTGGIMILDDYLWTSESGDPRDEPKLAIDAFLNVFGKKMRLFSGLPLYQMYAVKL